MHSFAIGFSLLALVSCSKEDPKSSDNRITSFQLNIEGKTYEGVINPENGKISFELEKEVQSPLVPTIIYPKSARISPSSTTPQNFNSIVRYTVTAENGAEKTYTIIVSSPSSDISNVPPGDMTLVNTAFDGREVTIDWTDASDTDEVTYTVFKNSIEIGTYSISEVKMPFTYNQTEKIAIYATDLKGGTSKLEIDLPTPKSELILVKNFAGVLYVIDTKVRDILWVGKSVDGFFAPVVNGNQVFSSFDKKLISLDLLTGKELEVFDSIISPTYGRHSDLTFDKNKNTIFFKNGDGGVHAVDANGKGQLWYTYLSNINSALTPTVLDENNLYTMRGRNDILYAIDKTTGAHRWQYSLQNGSSGGVPFTRGTPKIIGQAIIFGDYGHLYSLSKETGEANWVIDLPNNGRPSSFTKNGEELIVIAESNVYSINPSNGAVLWSNVLPNYVVSTPFLNDDILYLGVTGNGFGSVMAMNANNGETLWEKSVEGSVSASPVMYDGKLYINDSEGFMYCFDKNDGGLIWTITIGDHTTSSPTFVKGNGETIIYPNEIGFN